jgi:hypothetical protein
MVCLTERNASLMRTPFTGGCACGAVRYEGHTEPTMTLNCYCRACQRASGSTVVSVLFLPATALSLIGELKYHTTIGGSGELISRGFCPACGSPVVIRAAVLPDLILVHATSLDDPSWFRPTMDIWTSSAQPWAYMNPELTKYPGRPPAPN